MATAALPNTLVGTLDPADRSALLTLGSFRRYAPGERLIHEGDDATDVFLLLTGVVRVEGSTVDGRSVLLTVRVAGDMVGELAGMTGTVRSAAVVALTEVTTRVIPWPRLHAALAGRPLAAAAVHASVAVKFRQATRHRIEVAAASPVARLAAVLNHLAKFYGRPTSDGIEIGLPLSQGDLARLAGISEPSVRRAATKLRRQDLIRVGYRRQVVTDLTALVGLLEGRPPAQSDVMGDPVQVSQADR